MKSFTIFLVLAAAVLCSTNAFAVPQIVTVSVTGSGADYSNIAAALGAISDASSSKPYEILVYPGIYTGANNGGWGLAWKSWVSLRGADRESTILRGSTSFDNIVYPVIDFTGVQGVEVSNITIDGTTQLAIRDSDFEGSICVADASIKFSHVRLINGQDSWSPAFTLTTGGDGCYSSTVGNIVVQDSDIGPVADFGGNWTIRNTSITAAGDGDAMEYIYAYARVGSEYNGNVMIIGSTLEARATVYSPSASTNAVWLGYEGSGAINIIGSSLVANNDTVTPSGVTAPVYNDYNASGMKVTIQGSELYTVSQSGVSYGAFYGVYEGEGSSVPIVLRASSIQSFGSGGTRADIYNDSAAANVNVEATENATVVGDYGTTTADSRQGQYSSDLIVPLTSPTLGPVNGQIWIDTGTNKICYRSGGTTRCVLGS
ncbi:MAG TPA: hypothetical protein VFB49_06885 [Patescibacteria group bacterium]|nr:hypothetical protein [Patescibacteria group bacterium]